MLILSSLDLSIIFRLEVASDPLNHICFDPTNLIIAGTFSSLAAISLIENQIAYKYMDMGKDTYMTVVMPKSPARNNVKCC